MDPRALIETRARSARAAARAMALCPTKTKNEALQQMARGLVEKSQVLLEANRADVERARGRVAKAFLDRLTLTESRIEEMAQGLREIAMLPDPVGAVVESWRRPNGIEISRVRVPLGVVGFIYESRPNVTADAAGLCVKSGNAVVLRGGSEAIESNIAIAAVLAKALEKVGAPADAVQFVDTTDRAAVRGAARARRAHGPDHPAGRRGAGAVVSRNARVPVLKHDKGVVPRLRRRRRRPRDGRRDRGEREGAAAERVQRDREPAGARAIAPSLPAVAGGAPRRGRRRAARLPADRALVPGDDRRDRRGLGRRVPRPMSSSAWSYDLDEAIEHIARHGTGLAEAIVTDDTAARRRFTRRSTRPRCS